MQSLYGRLMEIISERGVDWESDVATAEGVDQLKEARALIDAMIVFSARPKQIKIIYDTQPIKTAEAE
jgi:hypothetical protein